MTQDSQDFSMMTAALRRRNRGPLQRLLPVRKGNRLILTAGNRWGVRIPADAQLSDAYSMVAWFPTAKKLGHRPVGINWNRDPAEGPVGVRRTDFAGGCAMGATSLRDGNWHHVVVSFAAGADGNSPVQVKQYVDGRLESTGIVPGRTRGPAGRPNGALVGRVWLGCRLKANAPQAQRFKGEIDELVIADCDLEPGEIVDRMRTNELPVAAAAVRP